MQLTNQMPSGKSK